MLLQPTAAEPKQHKRHLQENTKVLNEFVCCSPYSLLMHRGAFHPTVLGCVAHKPCIWVWILDACLHVIRDMKGCDVQAGVLV